MILIFLLTFSEALKWSKNGKPLVKLERKRAKLSRNIMKSNYLRQGKIIIFFFILSKLFKSEEIKKNIRKKDLTCFDYRI